MSFARIIGTGALGVGAALLLMQIVPTPHDNPPVVGDIGAPPPVAAVLRTSCYDCHSNETHWPFYSRVAPVSWLLARQVARGRQELNFSEWQSYFPATRKRKLLWIGRSLREEVMPPVSYRLLHPSGRLSAADRTALEQWINGALAEQVPDQPPKETP